MPSARRCSVRGCETTADQSDIRIFLFPKFEDQFKTWISFCDSSVLNSMVAAGKKLHRSHEGICANHFANVCFSNPQRSKIFKGVLPSLNPPLPNADVVVKQEPVWSELEYQQEQQTSEFLWSTHCCKSENEITIDEKPLPFLHLPSSRLML